MAMKYIKLYYDWKDATDELREDEKGRLIDAMLAYARGEPYVLQGNERFLFPVFRAQIDRDAVQYDEICEKRREAGAKGGRQKQANASKSCQDEDHDHDQEKENENDNDNNKDENQNEAAAVDWCEPSNNELDHVDFKDPYLNRRINPSEDPWGYLQQHKLRCEYLETEEGRKLFPGCALRTRSG